MDVDVKLGATTPSLAPEISPSEWKKHKQFIHSLYVKQRRPLKEVQKELIEVRGFRVSEPQLKQRLRTWNFRKNTPSFDMDRIVEDIMQNDEKLLSEPHPDQSIESYGHHVRLSQVKRYMRRNNSPRGGRFASTAPLTPRGGAEDRRYDCTSMSVGGTARYFSDAMESPQRGTSWQMVMSRSLPELNSRLPWIDPDRSRPDNHDLALSRGSGFIKDGEYNRREYGKLFCCPYAKFDPLRGSPRDAGVDNAYRRCSFLILKTIPALKQHLYRVHKRPNYYCHRCFADFPDQNSCSQHARRGDCQVQHDQFVGRMTDEQFRQISRRRGAMDQQEIWYEIYAILFPEQRRPISPYNDDQESVIHLFNIFRVLGPCVAKDLYSKARGKDSEDHQVEPLPVSTQLVMDEAYGLFQTSPANRSQVHATSFDWSDYPALTISTQHNSAVGSEVYSLVEQSMDNTSCWTTNFSGSEDNQIATSEQFSEPLSILSGIPQHWTMV